MKKTVLFTLLLASFGANAQQKLIGYNYAQYDETGAVQYIDSSEFVYNSWGGSIYSNEPEFRFDGAVFDWSYDLPAIQWDVQNTYSGTSLPLSLTNTYNNTFVAGNATVSQSGNERIEFVYDVAGNLINEKYYFYTGTAYELSYESAYEFDANNNLTLEVEINHNGGTPVLESVDSLFYDASNNLIRYVEYYLDGLTSNLVKSSESLITYNGTIVSNIELYQETGPGTFEWVYDIDYTYSGLIPSQILGYAVVGGVPETTPLVEFNYTYGSNGKISLYEGFLGGDLFQQYDYMYDGQDFITAIDESSFDFNTSMLYVEREDRFYYQSTAEIDEVELAKATVFPNPSSDFITISTDSEIQEVAIYAASGAIMLTQKNGEIAISNLPAGVYTAKVKTSTGIAQARFVKQ